jgi:pimeloyl-ACP methyl ester carboxylesterase
MGGFVALELAHSYPDLVRKVFISGTYDMKHAFPKGMYALPWVSAFIRLFVPITVDQEQHRKKGIMWSRAFTRDARDNSRLSIVRQGAREIRHFDLSRLVVRQQTLAVAARRMDSVEEVAALVGVLKRGNVGSTGAYVEEAEHQWNLQRPELFAAGIQAWFEYRDLPEEFRPLTTAEMGGCRRADVPLGTGS